MGESAYEKVSVTLPRNLVEAARRRAGDRGFSAYVAEGLRLAEHFVDLDEFLAAHAAQHGPVPDEILDEVRQQWPDPAGAVPTPGSPSRRRSSSTPTE